MPKITGYRGRRSARIKSRSKPFYRISKKRRAPYTAKIIPNIGVPRNVAGFPQEIITKLKYVDNITLSSSSFSISKNAFKMNSIFDPDVTGVGHQPLYTDQFSPVYNRYTVLGSKLTVMFTSNTPTTTASSSIVGVVGDDDGTTSSTLTAIQEANKCDWTALSNSYQGAGTPMCAVTYSPERDLGLSPDDDTVSASVTADPSAAYYASVFASDLNGSATATIVFALVEIEYTVKFSRPKTIAQS